MVTTNEKKERKKVLFGGWLVGLIENLGRASQKERKKEKKFISRNLYAVHSIHHNKKVRGQQQNLADNLLDDD